MIDPEAKRYAFERVRQMEERAKRITMTDAAIEIFKKDSLIQRVRLVAYPITGATFTVIAADSPFFPSTVKIACLGTAVMCATMTSLIIQQKRQDMQERLNL